MGDRLKGKVAVVTGSGGGIGRGEALALASEGAKVVVNDVGAAVTGAGSSSRPADAVVTEIKAMGGEAVANYDSVSVKEGAENIIKTALNAFGKLDILVNNAGILRDRMIFNMSDEEFDSVIKVHLYGTFYCTRAACVLFRQQRSGRIICTSSISGLGNRGQSNYSAAKEGIVGLVRTVALEMGRYGVTCNSIRPNAGTRMTLSDDMRQAAQRTGNLGLVQMMEALKPEDIAPMVVWLASDAAANVNGRNFFVQTGRIALFSEPTQIKSITKQGGFTIDELFKLVPEQLTGDLVNPAPPEAK
ncbi:MAG: SDR family oxidoreductase [Dehalococcoidia bacterium]|nr:SDR family oxidoreductase [Dehalococcoidia bacterium]